VPARAPAANSRGDLGKFAVVLAATEVFGRAIRALTTAAFLAAVPAAPIFAAPAFTPASAASLPPFAVALASFWMRVWAAVRSSRA